MIYKGSIYAWAVLALVLVGSVACDDDSGTTDDAVRGDGGDGDGDGDGDASTGDGDAGGDGDGDGDGDSGVAVGVVEPNPDGVDPLPPLDEELTLPIVFVHGFAGSAQQYESQAQRFVANGYPIERIYAYDHDGAGFGLAAYADGVDEVVNQALEDFDVEQVYLVGHSRGTSVSSIYLGNPERLAKVAKYIALDGSPCPTTLPCIAPTQAGLPGQAHVEVATSAESFAMQYEFLVGEAPEVVDIVPQKEPVEIKGRAVSFPANTGRAGTHLEIWELDGTGHRATAEPHAEFDLPEDGSFGPVLVDSRKHYEFALSAEEGSTHHLYMQRFLRDNHFVRLLSGDMTSPTRMNTNTSDDHTTIILMRMREWYAVDDPDLDGDQADVVEIGVSGGGVDEVEPTSVLPGFVGNGAIGVHIHDDAATPKESSLGALPYFASQAFQAGVDFYIPASEDASGTITITHIPRGETDKPQTLRVPNWRSSAHAVTVQLADFAQ